MRKGQGNEEGGTETGKSKGRLTVMHSWSRATIRHMTLLIFFRHEVSGGEQSDIEVCHEVPEVPRLP